MEISIKLFYCGVDNVGKINNTSKNGYSQEPC